MLADIQRGISVNGPWLNGLWHKTKTDNYSHTFHVCHLQQLLTQPPCMSLYVLVDCHFHKWSELLSLRNATSRAPAVWGGGRCVFDRVICNGVFVCIFTGLPSFSSQGVYSAGSMTLPFLVRMFILVLIKTHWFKLWTMLNLYKMWFILHIFIGI